MQDRRDVVRRNLLTVASRHACRSLNWPGAFPCCRVAPRCLLNLLRTYKPERRPPACTSCQNSPSDVIHHFATGRPPSTPSSPAWCSAFGARAPRDRGQCARDCAAYTHRAWANVHRDCAREKRAILVASCAVLANVAQSSPGCRAPQLYSHDVYDVGKPSRRPSVYRHGLGLRPQ